jgi:WS/DGAT/MGAT family acyltransferase
VRTLAALRRFLPAPPTSLNGPLGPRRRFDWIHTTLPEVKRMRRLVPGSTLNDVMLTAVAQGLRELFLARGEDVAPIRPRVFVPVDVRDEAGAEAGNVFSALVLPLPIDEPDVVARLRLIASEMATLKSGHQAQAMRLAMNLSELIPPVLQAAGAWQTHHRGMFMNLTVTNVPGPRRELYLLGAKMLELNPMLPLATGLTLNVAVESYLDRLSAGLCCDPEKVPDLDVFKRGVATALDELLARATHEPAVADA